MVEFIQSTLSSRLRVAFIALHGITDLCYPVRVGMYALALCLPMDSDLVTACFLAASVFHFSADMGTLWSMALHVILAFMYCSNQQLLATETMIWYLSCVHVPLHYIRILNEDTPWAYASVSLALCATLLYAFKDLPLDVRACTTKQNTIILTHTHQRLIIAHVLSIHLLAK